MRKRITAIVALLCMLIASLPAGMVMATADGEDYSYDSAVGILTGLGILDTEMANRPITSEMSRKDFVVLLMKCVGVDETMAAASEQRYFYDVKATDENAGYIARAYEMGVTLGVEEGIFGATLPVTIEQGIIMCMRALNYDLVVDGRPAEIADYLSVAKRMDLYRNIEMNVGSSMSYRDAYVLLYNCMTTDFLVSYRTDDDKTAFFKQEGNSAIEGYFGMKVIEGVINNTPYGAQSAKEYTEQGTVTIGENLFRVGDTDAEQRIGYKVKAYYREEDADKKLVWLDMSETDVVKVMLKDIVEYRPLSFTYTNEKGDDKEYKVAKDALTLYNGQVYSVTGKVTMPQNGYVELIENNGDNSYDVVKIVDYSIVIAGGFNASMEYLSDARDTTKNKDLSQFDYYKVMDIEGNEYQLADVPNGIVLQIAYNGDKRFAEIVVVEDTVSFAVRSTKAPVADCYVSSIVSEDGVTYNVSKTYDTIKGNQPIVVGNSYNFLLDVNGDIVASSVQTNQMRYGYLKQYTGSTGAFGNKTLVRMFTHNGIFEDLEIAKKVRIHNGSKDSTYAAENVEGVLEWIKTPSIVRYSVDNKGMINALEFPGTITEATGFRKAGEIADTTTSTSFRYRSDSKSFGGKVVINDGTVIFAIPSDPEKEESYYCIDSTGLLTSTLYSGVTGYTAKVLSPVSEAVTLISDSMQSAKNVVMLFDHLEKTYNAATQKTEIAITGYVGTSLMTYKLDETVQDESEFTFTFPVTLADGTKEKQTFPYQKGDYIQLQFDYTGAVKVSKILRLYSEALQKTPDEDGVNEVPAMYPSTGMNTNNRYDAGKIVNIIDGYLQIKNERDTSVLEATEEYYMISNATVYFVLDKERDTLTPGSVADLVADGSRIFAHTKYGVLNTVLIIKE